MVYFCVAIIGNYLLMVLVVRFLIREPDEMDELREAVSAYHSKHNSPDEIHFQEKQERFRRWRQEQEVHS